MSLFVTLLCASHVYASCTYSADSNDCTPFPTSTIVGLAIGGIILLAIVIFGRILRRRRLQRVAQATFLYGTPSNSYGRPQSNVYHPYPTQSQCPPGLQSSRPIPGQMNSLNRNGMPVAPSFPQLSKPSPTAHSARMRSPTMPSPTHYSNYSNQTAHISPPSSPNSARLPPPGFPLSPSPPSTHSRVSADTSTVQAPSIRVTSAHTPPVRHSSPPENVEMRTLTVQTEVANDEPPPAYTPI
ncbi:uncharacterized protein F5891DRAFT_1180221 [Suillus fuscotomentosus]|uniref:Uncharacterized protein n=1 Tax=Suillus fuscotomentosus TaxID=1912939 RepID=A0AAD4HUL9_9AGAM|nr:uncharacterized protein F5891DRAFT_1180221 [Suillus fuscotomentosus]KAG1908681.1 hypothetical protein F5891DRAFT_1180221 [Suillus fuscotomentosus]